MVLLGEEVLLQFSVLALDKDGNLMKQLALAVITIKIQLIV